MIDRAYAITMARYNRWMNARLYACAERLSDEQRRQDRGAFFKSLHGTLDHLISGDTMWMYRFTGRSIENLTLGGRFDTFAEMRAHRESLDQEISAWAATVDSTWLASDFAYYSKAYDMHYTKPAWLLVTHFFNHQTHHRGQATTLLMQFGIDPEATDLPVMPGT
ncbi:MAG: damage-inducible protein DinB [Hydrocarboniphaga sp.]|uniref:DinB family protein n=1 Tax=Hydrocarboniphaga sp. TaxID=2033016 RepID=UPI0026084A39|nr:DinB family protein [Hydrocarboniphaga sp.]MDB5972156.1 damage-inducible protein DinB [Hydrocarboniphaga sp.]